MGKSLLVCSTSDMDNKYWHILCSMLDHETLSSIINRNFIGVSKLSVPIKIFVFQICMLSVRCRIQNLRLPQQPLNRHRQQQKQQNQLLLPLQLLLLPHVQLSLLPVITIIIIVLI